MDKKFSLPSKKSVEEAIRVIEAFRAMCQHQMDLGYWATIDFPSKHHFNKILPLSYRIEELDAMYGPGLARHIREIMPVCKAYTAFLRGPNEKVESKGQPTPV